MKSPGYDVIGDVHSHAKVLRRLLHQMEYAENKHDVWPHPSRRVMPQGDFRRRLHRPALAMDFKCGRRSYEDRRG